MPSVVATLKVKEDMIDEAKAFLTRLAKDTLEKEPGTLAYTVHQRKDDAATFVFYEKYESDAALAEHSENLKAVGGDFVKILAGAPEIVFLDEL
ncbi:MAG: antibiotic biosynthesis monooxygenase [Myxococcota bacterium]|nr:antibiotic biosynthesis monooxygenase [Myxococcota bacterium]